ncbi:unnamed protein product, partial [Ixodes persulcatus]
VYTQEAPIRKTRVALSLLECMKSFAYIYPAVCIRLYVAAVAITNNTRLPPAVYLGGGLSAKASRFGFRLDINGRTFRKNSVRRRRQKKFSEAGGAKQTR